VAASAGLAAASCSDDDDDDGGGVSASGGTGARGGKGGVSGKAAGGMSKGGASKGGTAGSAGSIAGASALGGGGGASGEAGAGESGMAADAGAGGEGGVGTLLADPCRGIELPEDQHFVAEGLCVRAIATEQGNLRQLTFASNGDLLGVTSDGEIRRFRDLDGDGAFLSAGDIVELGSTDGANGNNAHLDEPAGYLYAGTLTGAARWPYQPSDDALGTREDVVINQPSSGSHSLHTVHVYDGYLYVHSGSEENAVAPAAPDYDTHRSVLKRFDLDDFEPGTPFDWTAGEVVVLGVRNMVGFTRDSEGRMYGVINGLDNVMYGGEDVHLTNPGDDLIRIEAGEAHGYPYCFTAADLLDSAGEPIPAGTQLVSATDPAEPDPDFTNPNDQAFCDENSAEPETFLPAHSAPLDMVFFDGPAGNLPDDWRGGAFIALHGSWDTTPSVGHRVVWMPFDEDGNAPMPEASETGTSFPFTVVFGGGSAGSPVDGSWGWSDGSAGEDPVRPVGVAISPLDGALYVSSDNAQAPGEPGRAEHGALYRVGLRRD
jgi:glucose/arabinose dehydrogenase